MEFLMLTNKWKTFPTTNIAFNTNKNINVMEKFFKKMFKFFS